MADAHEIEPDQHPGMTETTSPAAAAYAPLRIWVHALIGVAVGLISPFTGLAWPFALMLGMTFGASSARRERGERSDFALMLLTAFAMAFGILGMLVFGAIIGGLIAIPIVFLAAFSESAAAHASSIDRGVARILVFIIPIAMWFIVFPLIGMNVNLQVGS